MDSLRYSVIIRTTGKAHEKYQRLLDSLSNLKPEPEEIIVVLPEGFPLPDEQLGVEKYYFSPKGMVIQRMTGIKMCNTRYALICDDDVSFDPDFVQKLFKPLEMGIGYFSAGPLYSFLPPKGAHTILCAIMGSAAPTLFHRDRYNSVLFSGGYSYNRHLDMDSMKFYETQSAAWTCFFADIDILNKIKFEDEKWLDSHGYSYLDDQTMFYKAWLKGYKTIVVSNAQYVHLDGKTSTKNNKPAVTFSINFNRVVFWHRFIYSQQTNIFLKGLSKICFLYRLLWIAVYDRICLLRHKSSYDEHVVAMQGLREGIAYLKSDDYKALPPV